MDSGVGNLDERTSLDSMMQSSIPRSAHCEHSHFKSVLRQTEPAPKGDTKGYESPISQ